MAATAMRWRTIENVMQHSYGGFMTSLAKLNTNHRAEVVAIHLPAEECQRLSAFGMQPGAQVQVFRRAGLGGPLHIAVGTTQLLMRRLLAESIHVQLQG